MGLWIFLILMLFAVIISAFLLFKEVWTKPEKAQRIKKKHVQLERFKENLKKKTETEGPEDYISNNAQKIDEYLNKKMQRKEGTPEKDR